MIFQFSDGEFSDPIATSLKMWKKKISFTHSSLAPPLENLLRGPCQCATIATEVVEVATESEEDVIINCAAIFYEEGKEGENFRRAVRFNNRLLH